MAAFATPILKPLWPFFTGMAITFVLINKAANAGMASEEHKNDPRNPQARRKGGH